MSSRHPQAAIAQGRQHPDRHVVVGDEDRRCPARRSRRPRELEPAARRPVAVRRLDDLEPVRRQLVAPSAGALDRVRRLGRSGQVQHRRVAQLDQVTHGGAGAAVLIDRDDRRVRGAPVAATAISGMPRSRPRTISSTAMSTTMSTIASTRCRSSDSTTDRMLAGSASSEADRVDAVAGRARGEVEVRGDRGRPVVGPARCDQPDRAGAAGDQGTRRRRGAVAQLGDGALDPRAGRRAHVRQVVEHARDGLVRDARQARDVEDVGGPRRGVVSAAAGRHSASSGCVTMASRERLASSSAGRRRHHLSVAEHGDARRHPQNLLEFRRDEDHRHAVVGQLVDQILYLDLSADVDAPSRLVEQQHTGREGEQPGEQHLLLVASGEGARRAPPATTGRMPSASIQLAASSRCRRRLMRRRNPRSAWMRERDVLAHGELVDDALGLAVLRRVGDPSGDRLARGRGARCACPR